jgi:hypothetical protein
MFVTSVTPVLAQSANKKLQRGLKTPRLSQQVAACALLPKTATINFYTMWHTLKQGKHDWMFPS